ncbi:MAG: shikimate dehydrogenase [Chitinispirillales bacterium]|jgi:shikimate dehydrogenase|nr:shikimate dehydrogenase [Chitinispirillales bacterium]
MNVVNISGKTKIAGIVGNPISHSLSPKIHNYLFEKFEIDAAYVPFQIKNEKDLKSFVETFRSANFLGCNITVPYKSSIFPFIDEMDEVSQITDTANTLFWKDGKLWADTTDFWGFMEALNRDDFHLTKKNAVFLGNGGIARTLAVLSAFRNYPQSITLVGRNVEKLEKLSNEIVQKAKIDVSYFLFENAKEAIGNADIIINCTSVGMHPLVNESLLDISLVNRKTYLFDTIYNPLETKFLRDGKANGNRTQNGLYMLIYQALASFYFWTKKDLTHDNNLVLELEKLLLKEFDK